MNGLGHLLEGAGQEGQGAGPGVGEHHLPSGASEQRRASKLLQLADLLADGPGGHIELFGGASEGKVPPGGLKSPQGV